MTKPTSTVKVTIELPAWMWWKISGHAEKRGITVAGWIADAIRETLDLGGMRHKRLTHRDMLEEELAVLRTTRFRVPR